MQYNDLPWNMFQVGGVLTIVSQAFVIVLRSLGEKKEVFLGSHGLFISAIPQVATRKNQPFLIIRPCSLGLVVRKICATAGSLLNLFSVISFHMWPTLDPLTLPPLQNNAGRRWEVCVFLLLCGESALRFSDLVESHFVAVAAITLAVYQNTANCFLSRLRAFVCIFCRDFFFQCLRKHVFFPLAQLWNVFRRLFHISHQFFVCSVFCRHVPAAAADNTTSCITRSANIIFVLCARSIWMCFEQCVL